MKNKKKWYLYWVTSDGFEDCFVIAQSVQAAKSLEFQTNGFEWNMVKAKKVMEVPERYDKIENYLWIRRSRIYCPEQAKIPNIHRSAYYASHWILERLGAQWRVIDNKEQMLLLDIVYTCDEKGEWYTYSIGARTLIENMNKNIKFNFNDYSTFEADTEKFLYEMMGRATKECHEIEFYFSNSFIFAVPETQKKRYDTIGDFLKCWSKKTLGNIITSIEDGFKIDEKCRMYIRGFIDMRNQFVHGLTSKERYDITDEWGRRELINFLVVFLDYCDSVKKIAEACFVFSMYFANTKLIDCKENKIPIEMTEDIQEKIALFKEVFILK